MKKKRYAAQIERVHQKKIVRRKKTHQSTDNSSDSSDSCYYDETEDTDSEDRINLEISVTDTGIGMPADRLPRLFKSFSQIDISTARKYGGTGLGLAISSMLVSRMGGELWVESEEGVGSRFALTLPMAIAQEPPSPSSSTSSNDSFVPILCNNIPQPTSTTGLQNMLSKTHFPETAQTVPKKVEQEENLAIEHPIKILLAEDNILNQKIALSILKRLGYQDVTTAGNGREALELMIKHDYDVIFMDLYMPEMDGLEATRNIRERNKMNAYIIALTASATKQDRQICIEVGMDDFINAK
ncbi:hypothetical protein G6F22_004516 [Rhizopus arrhizus]|nr:hypothetical protein G6F22_004516 [Rhizopus arrhizus]